ncbi:MAG TPA: GAF domain-containing protein, partial [Anaerolineales bacterium]|nr:GAF domain-containing protein [Anaerolineales bacterium]
MGVFLLDERKEFAILRSSNTEAGQKLLDNDYRIPVKQSKLIGFVVRTGRPHLIHSSEDQSVFLHSLELPQSQSELLLPLKAGEQVIGILDIHSAEPDDFSQDDVAILSILGDQVAITLQNLLLYEESQNAWRRATSASAQSSTEAWKHYKKAIEIKGYRYDGIKSEPLRAVRHAGNGTNALSVPIQLRGQTIGSFNLKPSDPTRAWTDDELMMVRA